MRLNVYLAQQTGISRRAADRAIAEGKVSINGKPAELGHAVQQEDTVAFDSQIILPDAKIITIILNKPAGYVCSRDGQGSKTIYDLLPASLHNLKPAGRLDKDSSGLLLMTNDGQLANQLTHPSYQKTKLYEVKLNKPLAPLHQQMISDHGIELDDGLSRLILEKRDDAAMRWQVTMREGRNRQIRRTFAALGYSVARLKRTVFGGYTLIASPDLRPLEEGSYVITSSPK